MERTLTHFNSASFTVAAQNNDVLRRFTLELICTQLINRNKQTELITAVKLLYSGVTYYE